MSAQFSLDGTTIILQNPVLNDSLAVRKQQAIQEKADAAPTSAYRLRGL